MDMDKLPTLITHRSAEELRDAGIAYAYKKAGLHVGLVVVFAVIGANVFLYLSGKETPLALLLIGVVAMAAAFWCGHTAVYPHTPRLTLEELDTMKNDIGLRPDVFKQTYDSVLHGSAEEHQAIEKAHVVLEQISRAANKV